MLGIRPSNLFFRICLTTPLKSPSILPHKQIHSRALALTLERPITTRKYLKAHPFHETHRTNPREATRLSSPVLYMAHSHSLVTPTAFLYLLNIFFNAVNWDPFAIPSIHIATLADNFPYLSNVLSFLHSANFLARI